ncbi:MAG TPA: hypothetical protein VFW11_14060 [Cyclobacteriaceae bacterium]|nr:hypothetical protein [Cyclobacteriaceae bacterium]
MQKSLLAILIGLLLTSCKEVSFYEPQPKGKTALTEVPRKLQGKYLPYDEGPDSDTLVITSRGYQIHPTNAGSADSIKEEVFLSDSLVLKYFKGYYFASIYDKPQWFLRVLQIQKNGDMHLLHFENEKKNFKDHLRRLSGEVKVDSLEVEGKMIYRIDPSPKELVGLIKKGFFNRTKWRRIQ